MRRFNRIVTERIGALEESFLGRDRPLGASRLLWEIGEGGADLHDLRDRLGLDSGYVSRLVRRLENEGLVVVEVYPSDRRRRWLRWTAAGFAEARELDRLSDLAASALLDRVPPGNRERLLEAIAEVERSLRATLVEIDVEDPLHPDVVHCFTCYANELDAKFAGGFDAGISISANPEELVVTCELVTEPPPLVTANVTVWPASGAPCASVARTMRGVQSGSPALPSWSSPANLVRVAPDGPTESSPPQAAEQRRSAASSGLQSTARRRGSMVRSGGR